MSHSINCQSGLQIFTKDFFWLFCLFVFCQNSILDITNSFIFSQNIVQHWNTTNKATQINNPKLMIMKESCLNEFYVILCLRHHLTISIVVLYSGKAFWPTSTSYYGWKMSSCLSSSSFVCCPPPLIPKHRTLFLFSSSKDVYTFKTPVYLCLSVIFADSPLVPVECKQTGYTMVTHNFRPELTS